MDSYGCGIQVGSYEFCRQIDSYRFRREIGAVGSYGMSTCTGTGRSSYRYEYMYR